jgi:hypothetical protein
MTAWFIGLTLKRKTASCEKKKRGILLHVRGAASGPGGET